MIYRAWSLELLGLVGSYVGGWQTSFSGGGIGFGGTPQRGITALLKIPTNQRLKLETFLIRTLF